MKIAISMKGRATFSIHHSLAIPVYPCRVVGGGGGVRRVDFGTYLQWSSEESNFFSPQK